jgi:hypothetical protein
MIVMGSRAVAGDGYGYSSRRLKLTRLSTRTPTSQMPAQARHGQDGAAAA